MYLAASSVLIPAKNVLTQDGTSPFGTIPTRASMLIPKEREKCATVSSFGLVFPRSKGNAAIRRPELFGQFNLCQAKLMPCPVQGNSKKIANIVHTFTLPIVFILIGTTLLMNAVELQDIRIVVLITRRNSEVLLWTKGNLGRFRKKRTRRLESYMAFQSGRMRRVKGTNTKKN